MARNLPECRHARWRTRLNRFSVRAVGAALVACAGLTGAPVAIAQPARPATPAQRSDSKKAELDNLLGGLKSASSEEEAASLEERVRQKWIEAGSPAATLLMNRGLRNLHNDAGEDALGDFDAVLALEPELQAAFSYRARAKYLVGDYSGALRDTQAALQREPRNFVALQNLSRIAEARGDLKGALQAWQKLLEIDPKTPEADKRLRELNRKVNGETT